jgi:SAM-dependent methyltransferase
MSGMPSPEGATKFDAYSRSYEELHAASVSASGEPSAYFARYKLQCLQRAAVPTTQPILDYGCGIGSLTTLLAEEFSDVHGYDPSAESIRLARERIPGAKLYEHDRDVPDDHFSTVVLSGVLHHVLPAQRRELLGTVLSKLKPGGALYVFEHNPLNPLTRRAVAACEFDDDAILLWPWEVVRELRGAGFARVVLDYIVFFPRPLAWLRPLEPRLAWLPLGAQTLVRGTRID